tara:strand:+ start:2193 stop:2915 length:723 start_codon:yes stop_codon:yes gene_type:complete
MKIEICSNSIESVINANNAGANRIELCSGLNIGGLTPSNGLIKLAVKKSKIPIHCLIRPREGHFIYNKYDFETIINDIQNIKKLGVKGIVVGVMNNKYDINIRQLEKIIEESEGLDVTYHRAFDCLKNQEKGIDILSSIGVKRILTSGACKSAIDGISNLIRWKSISSAKIEIQPGGGINKKNVIKFKNAGFSSIHLSGSKTIKWKELVPNNIDKTFFDQEIKISDFEILKNIISEVKSK